MNRLHLLATTAVLVGGTVLAGYAGLVDAAAADVVTLRNGDALEGKATDLGESVRLVHDAGTIELPWSEVEVIRLDAAMADVLGERVGAVETDDARGLYAAALWAERQGLLDQARELHERVVALDPDHAASRAALGERRTEDGWKGGRELLEAKGFVHHDGKWMLASEAEAAEREAARERRITEEEERAARLLENLGDKNPRVRKFAGEALASVDADLRMRLWRVGIRHRNDHVRAAAATGLGVKGNTMAARALLRASVMDTEPVVREAAGHALAALDIPEVARPLIRSLSSQTPQVRAHAADALGILGSRTSVETLIKRVHWVAGPSNRANIQVLNQISYISDFDVEIAQLAQIGDPIISQLREGVILDATVFGAEGWDTIVERRAYTRALSRITGKDFGDNAQAWAKWWIDEGRFEGQVAAVVGEPVATPR